MDPGDGDFKCWYNHGRRLRLVMPTEFFIALLCIWLLSLLGSR